MECALRGTGQWHARPVLRCAGLDLGRACQGAARHSGEQPWETFRLSFSGVSIGKSVHQEPRPKELEWSSVYRCLRFHCIDAAAGRDPGMTGRNGTRTQDSQQAVPSPRLSSAPS